MIIFICYYYLILEISLSDLYRILWETLVYYDDENIIAKVVGDKEVEFEDKVWRLSPLTREMETRKNRRNPSGAYWGINMWKYQGRTLEDWMNEIRDYESELE